MQTESIIVYRRTWCEDSDAAVEYFNRQGIDYREVDIEREDYAGQGVKFVTGGHHITPTLAYRLQAIVFDPWNPDRFEAWWRFANADFSEAQERPTQMERGQ